jgi:DASH complex subunit DAD2
MASQKLPKPKDEEDTEKKSEPELPLPQTLVRIPTQHAPALMEQKASAAIAD